MAAPFARKACGNVTRGADGSERGSQHPPSSERAGLCGRPDTPLLAREPEREVLLEPRHYAAESVVVRVWNAQIDGQ
jgi:hypothetical protein